MAKLQLTKSETCQFDTEEEAIAYINEMRDAARTDIFEVSKAAYVKKEKKQKGEVIDEVWIANITYRYN